MIKEGLRSRRKKKEKIKEGKRVFHTTVPKKGIVLAVGFFFKGYETTNCQVKHLRPSGSNIPKCIRSLTSGTIRIPWITH